MSVDLRSPEGEGSSGMDAECHLRGCMSKPPPALALRQPSSQLPCSQATATRSRDTRLTCVQRGENGHAGGTSPALNDHGRFWGAAMRDKDVRAPHANGG